MSFIEVNPFVTDEEKNFFLSKIDEDDWIQHRNTKSGTLSPLNFKGPFVFRKHEVFLMKMYPNAVQDWHTDGVQFKRSTLILHPLTDNYAPFQSETDQSDKVIIADTQSKHAVFNNKETRLNLQIFFDVDYSEAIKDNSIVWKTLKSFWNE